MENTNQAERHIKQLLGMNDDDKNKEDSKMEGKKPIEESEGSDKKTEESNDPQLASKDEPNLGKIFSKILFF